MKTKLCSSSKTRNPQSTLSECRRASAFQDPGNRDRGGCSETPSGTSAPASLTISGTVLGPTIASTQRRFAYLQRWQRSPSNSAFFARHEASAQETTEETKSPGDAWYYFHGNGTSTKRFRSSTRCQLGWTSSVLAQHEYRQSSASINKQMAKAQGHQETENGTVQSLRRSLRVLDMHRSGMTVLTPSPSDGEEGERTRESWCL